MKATEQYFPVVLFIMLYKVVLTFESVDEILKCDHSNKSYRSVLEISILDLPIGSSASEALNKLKWKTLARRRAEHRATFIYKCLNNLFSHRFNIEFNKDKHDYNTRCKNNIRKSASSRNWGHWTVTNFASNDWNKLDLSIRQSPSLASFKRALRNVNSL